MIGKVFAVVCIISLVCALITGNIEKLSVSVVEGAEKAVTLVIALCGMMGLWNGMMNVLEKAGACRFLSKLIRPFLKVFFPASSRDTASSEAISASVAANMLGLGNAATPLGIRAMQSMKKIGADDDMITFTVMNTAPLSLMPSTLIALRSAGGAANPFDVVAAVWICSGATMMFSLLLSRLLALSRVKKPRVVRSP